MKITFQILSAMCNSQGRCHTFKDDKETNSVNQLLSVINDCILQNSSRAMALVGLPMKSLLCLQSAVKVVKLHHSLKEFLKTVKSTRPRTTVRNSDAQVCIVWEYNFDTFEQSSFQKYATYWVFLALCDMLYFCICVFVFVYFYLTLGYISFDILGPKAFRKCMVCMV